MDQNKWTISNTLILLSIIFTVLSMVLPIVPYLGLNSYFFDTGIYHIWIVQIFTSQFLHGGVLHLVFNGIFVYYFWNILEIIIGKKRMLLFFILNAIFVGVLLTFTTSVTTIGISSFALALLTYYTLVLWKQWNPEYTGGITAIVLNILIGFVPGISFLGHFFGMLFWLLYWLYDNIKLRWHK